MSIQLTEIQSGQDGCDARIVGSSGDMSLSEFNALGGWGVGYLEHGYNWKIYFRDSLGFYTDVPGPILFRIDVKWGSEWQWWFAELTSNSLSQDVSMFQKRANILGVVHSAARSEKDFILYGDVSGVYLVGNNPYHGPAYDQIIFYGFHFYRVNSAEVATSKGIQVISGASTLVPGNLINRSLDNDVDLGGGNDDFTVQLDLGNVYKVDAVGWMNERSGILLGGKRDAWTYVWVTTQDPPPSDISQWTSVGSFNTGSLFMEFSESQYARHVRVRRVINDAHPIPEELFIFTDTPSFAWVDDQDQPISSGFPVLDLGSVKNGESTSPVTINLKNNSSASYTCSLYLDNFYFEQEAILVQVSLDGTTWVTPSESVPLDLGRIDSGAKVPVQFKVVSSTGDTWRRYGIKARVVAVPI